MNGPKITTLQTIDAKPDQDVIDACLELLRRAKSGELRSLAYAGTLSGRRFYTGFETTDAIEAIGLLSMAHHNLCANRREQPEE